MRRSLSGTALALTIAAGAAPAAASDGDAPILLPLVLHVPAGAPDAGVARLLEALEEAYAPYGIAFEPRFAALDEAHRVLETIRERRALARSMVERAVNAFVVDRALDPHPSETTRRTAARHGFEPSGLLGGAHVPARGHRPGSYAIVTRDGSRYALAHELGHFLGAGHHPDPGNIMSYGSGRRTFDAAQVRVFRARARRLLRRGDLRLRPARA